LIHFIRLKCYLTSYLVRLSSLENWMCAHPIRMEPITQDEKRLGVDVAYRFPEPIVVDLPHTGIAIEVGQKLNMRQGISTCELSGTAYLKVKAHSLVTMERAREIAWQCENLMSLLIGHAVSVRSVEVTPLSGEKVDAPAQPCQLLYDQPEKERQEDVHAARMLMPYGLIAAEFPLMVESWFARSKQSVLAANVYFGSQRHRSPVVNVRFLGIMQAIESYHRSLGTGLYMDQEEFNRIVECLVSQISSSIQGDHRQSLKNRLKYGNEYSLRKRLFDMFYRVPENVRLQIAGDVADFIQRSVVDFRTLCSPREGVNQ
jgi:hypothetical protein